MILISKLQTMKFMFKLWTNDVMVFTLFYILYKIKETFFRKLRPWRQTCQHNIIQNPRLRQSTSRSSNLRKTCRLKPLDDCAKQAIPFYLGMTYNNVRLCKYVCGCVCVTGIGTKLLKINFLAQKSWSGSLIGKIARTISTWWPLKLFKGR